MAAGKGKRRDVVIFDFDRTITRHGTFVPFLVFACRKRPARALLAPLALAPAALYGAGAISRKALKERMMRLFLAGRTRAEIRALSQAFAARILEKGVYRKALETIEGHRREGRAVGIATASMDFYMAHVKDALGLDFLIATKSAFDSRERLKAGIPGENCYGEAKAKRVAAFLKRRKGRTGKVWFYSDHTTDRPTFALADHKIAVNPGPKLARLARARGYRVEWWD